jgi:thiol-disulfide isomerase/thioredoxin
MPITRLTYEDFLRQPKLSTQEPLASLVQREKTVYVYALTRDRCTGCEIQEPLFEKLANQIHEKYGDRVKFGSIHVSQDDQFREKLQDFRRVLRFAAYPTYLILLKTDVGIVETYRGIEPPMEEIARNIDLAFELAQR